MVKRVTSPRVFFGWWTVLTGTFLNFWGSAYTVYGFSALFKPLSTELGFTRAATSIATGIGSFEGGLLSVLVGWLVDRFGPRRVAVFGVLVFGLALMLMYFIQSLLQFLLVWGVMLGIGQNFASGLPMDKAIANWFVKRRGLAMSIRWLFSGSLILPLISFLIGTQGWRLTCLFGGIVQIVVGVPLVWFLIKDKRPEYYGLLPDGAVMKEETAGTSQMIERGVKYATEVEEVEFTLRQALRTPAFWLLIIAQGGYMMSHQAVAVHIIPFLTDIGINPVKAAATVTIASLFGIGARVIGGNIADRLHKGQLRFLFGTSFFLQGLGLVLIIWRPAEVMVYPFLILNYVGFGISIVLATLVAARYFGRKAFGFVRGFATMSTTPMAVLGPIYTGWVYDTKGNYIFAFTTLAAVFALAGVLMFLAHPSKPPAEITGIDKTI